MSVIVYKEGVSLRVEPDYLKHHLEMGWSLKPYTTKKQAPPKKPKDTDGVTHEPTG